MMLGDSNLGIPFINIFGGIKMILDDRRKCKYEIGSFTLKNKVANNMALFNKCVNFYREMVGDNVRNFVFDSSNISNASMIDSSIPITIASQHFDIVTEPLSVWVDYYERSLEFHRGLDVNMKLKVDNFIMSASNYGREEFADEFFRLLVTWYLPNRNIFTTVKGAGRYFPIILPIINSTIRSVEVSAVRGTSPKNDMSGIKELRLYKEYDPDLGEFTNWNIRASVYDDSGYQTRNLDEVMLSNKIFNRDTNITFSLGGIRYGSKYNEVDAILNF